MSRATIIHELSELYGNKCVWGMYPDCAIICNCKAECLSHKGWFKDDVEFEKVKTKYVFDARGFCGENGCRIPPEERSFTCITHLCPQAVRKIPQIERNLFAQLAKELKEEDEKCKSQSLNP